MAGRRSKKPMSSLHKMVMAQFKQLPQQFLAQFLAEKLGNESAKGLPEALAKHLLTNAREPFTWNDGEKDEESKSTIDLEITPEEIEEVVSRVQAFVRDELPGLIEKTSKGAANTILKTLKRDWPEQHAYERARKEAFRHNLEDRWGSGFNLLRMMLTIAREIGEEVDKRNKRSKKRRKDTARDVLMRLHVRACQITSEIIILMENGYADGAMARWRTLHEVVVVASLIAEHGTVLAERYLAHEAVEAKRAMDKFITCHVALGYKPPSKTEIREVEDAYAAALQTYGYAFGSQYGWAAHHLDVAKPTFLDLEVAAGRVAMRSHYQMASYNVHASPKGITFRLGLLGRSGLIISGASNAGFVEPGQNAALYPSGEGRRRRAQLSPQQRLYFLPEPQGHGSLRPTLRDGWGLSRSSPVRI